jgi:hypothetical protein
MCRLKATTTRNNAFTTPNNINSLLLVLTSSEKRFWSQTIQKSDLHEIETNDYPKNLDFCMYLKGLPTANKERYRKTLLLNLRVKKFTILL